MLQMPFEGLIASPAADENVNQNVRASGSMRAPHVVSTLVFVTVAARPDYTDTLTVNGKKDGRCAEACSQPVCTSHLSWVVAWSRNGEYSSGRAARVCPAPGNRVQGAWLEARARDGQTLAHSILDSTSH